VRRLYRERKNPFASGTHYLSAGEHGLVARGPDGEATIKWSAVDRVVTTPNHAFIYLSAVSAIVVPRRSVVSGNLDVFLHEVRQYHDRQAV
jgi:hypothetical protein